jgi:hypothetical protein
MSNRAIYFRKGKGNCDTIVTGKLRPQNGAIINGDTMVNIHVQEQLGQPVLPVQ